MRNQFIRNVTIKIQKFVHFEDFMINEKKSTKGQGLSTYRVPRPGNPGLWGESWLPQVIWVT